MWAKILAGVVAAAAVVGLGVYAALPPSTGGCGQQTACPVEPSGCPVASSGCCSLTCEKAADPDALAACTGGMAISAETTKACPVGACCAE